MAFQRFSSTDPADLAALLNRLGDDLEASPTSWGDVSGKPSTFPPAAHTHAWSAITGKPSTFTPASHTHAWTEVTGKPSTFTPASHSHAVGDVTGLGGRLDALEYFSGWRNITDLMAVQPDSGNLYVCREGRRVWIHASALRFPDSASFITLSGLLPVGFRPSRITDIAMGRRSTLTTGGAFRANPGDGTSYFYYVTGGQQIDGAGDFLTFDPIPAPGTEPGSPA